MLEINLNPEVAKKREKGTRAMLKAKLRFFGTKLRKLREEENLLGMQLTKFNMDDHENSDPIIAQILQKHAEIEEVEKEMQDTLSEWEKLGFGTELREFIKNSIGVIKTKTEKITGTVAGGISTIKSGVSRGAKKKESEIPPEDTPEERKKQKKEFLSDFNDFFDKKDETRRLETEKQAREIFENDRKEKERLEILSEQARTHARKQIELLEKANEAFRTGNLEATQDAQDESYDLDTNLDEELEEFLQKGENIPSDVVELIQKYKTMRTELVNKIRIAKTTPITEAPSAETVSALEKKEEIAPTPEPVSGVAEGWTEEKERTLQTLLETIEKAKRRIAELDEILETFPKTISLSPKDIEQEISMNLEPLLKKNNAILDEINIVIEGNKLKLEIKFTVKKLGMSFPLSIKAIIGNYYNSITLEDHSYEGSQKDKAKEKLDPQIGNLVPELIKFLEKKYGRKIYNLQIKDSNLEISMEAKK
jgi:hypothetical protein